MIRSRAQLWLLAGAGGLVLAAGSFPARAEHFDILLRVTSAKGAAEASWDTSPPEGGLNPRQTVTAAAGEELYLEWRFRSEFPHGNVERVRVRLFVVPEARIGQKAVPPESTPAVVDNRFTSTFHPHHAAKGHLYFRAPAAGNYLVRLESEETIKEHGHEHFAAVDLKVE
jgi:hypothetical protein